VPSAGTRRALLERGDADLSYDLPPKDAAEMSGNKDLHVISTAMAATLQFLSMNVKMKPFDDVRVRRAVAYALPYDKILEVALYGRAKKMSGGPAKVSSPVWPQPSPYVFDPSKAKALLAEAGYPNGFDVTLSFDLSAAVINEPMCVLIQESLGQVGVRVTLDNGRIVEPGTVGCRLFQWYGIVGGKRRIQLSTFWKLTTELEPQWDVSSTELVQWTVTIEGTPAVKAVVSTCASFDPENPKYQTGGEEAAMFATAMHVLNAVPPIVNAAPGVKTFLDLPIYGSRGAFAD